MSWLKLSLFSMFFSVNVSAVELNVLTQFNYVLADDRASWFERDTGILAYSDNGFHQQQSLAVISDSFSSGLSYEAVGHYYQQGEQHVGFSQAFVSYKPLSGDHLRWRGRVGVFYPKVSLENVDLGWLSPYTYTQSAINSWFGEELRTTGAELTLFSAGRSRNSAFSFELNTAAFKANDSMGAVLTWRGFALHDRQSLNHEQIPVAPYPTVIDADGLNHPGYVEPFHEFDVKFGYYVGAHVDYFKQSSLRYYYYDNQADPNAVNPQRLYGWRSYFHSLALQHKFNANTRIVGQWLAGHTVMGEHFVAADFDAWFVLLSHGQDAHRFSLRYDHFSVTEDDVFPWDWNDSHGAAWTAAWRYDLNNNWQVGAELHWNKNYAHSRQSLNQDRQISQQQSMVVLQYRFAAQP